MRQPHLHAWADAGQPLQLVEQTVARPKRPRRARGNGKTTAAPPDAAKALACYGVLLRHADTPVPTSGRDAVWLRFVTGRPVSGVTTQFLAWCAEQTAAHHKTALLLVWDNASWHVSAEVRAWLRAHNQHVKQTGQGVRLLVCGLPSKSPWLNPIEPKWVHAKRAVAEPARLLTPAELEDRICAYYACAQFPHLTLTEKVA